MDDTNSNPANRPWTPPPDYFRVRPSPVQWDTKDPTAPAVMDGRRESPRANRALRDYCSLDENQTLAALLQKYRSDPAAPTRSLDTLKKWSTAWNWRERLQDNENLREIERKRLYNQRRSAIIETGLSIRHERIEKLKNVYASLEPYLADPDFIFPRHVKRLPTPDGGFELIETRRFNAEVIAQLRGLLADLARETGSLSSDQPPEPEVGQLDLSRLSDLEQQALRKLVDKATGEPYMVHETIIIGPDDPEPDRHPY